MLAKKLFRNDLNTRTRSINRKLRDVSAESATPALESAVAGAFDGMLPMLSAADEEE